MDAKQSKALEVCYSNACAGKRLGLPPGAVEDIKRRNRREPQSGEGISDINGKIGLGGFEIGGSLDGDISLSVPGISLSIENNGEGSLRLPGGIRMDVVKDGCYFVKNFYIGRQLAYQDVELDPDCEEEEEEPEEPEKEPGDFDDSDLPEDENDEGFDEDFGESFDEGDGSIHDNDEVLAIYGYKYKEVKSYTFYPGPYDHRDESLVVNQIQYEVLETRQHKGMTIPHRIFWTRTDDIHDVLYYTDGETQDNSGSNEQNLTDFPVYLYEEPSCPIRGYDIGYVYRGWGRTIKAQARQIRGYNKYYNRSNYFRSKTYEGWQVVGGGTSAEDHCPWEEADAGPPSIIPDYPNYRRYRRQGCQLLKRIKLKEREEKGKPPGNIGRKPPEDMDKRCCKMLKEIHEALAVEELQDEGFQIPGRLIAPNANRPIKADNYLKILALQFQAADHLGLHPFKASLTDANAAQVGNQKVEIQFASGTAGMRQIVELLLENKGDAAARLNLQVRTAVAIAQVLKVATITSKTASAIASFIGMPLREKISKIRMPFDISLGRRRNLKGFDPAAQKEQAIEAIEMNEETSTEEILPEFLQTGEQPYIHESYDGNFPNLIEQLKGQGRNG